MCVKEDTIPENENKEQRMPGSNRKYIILVDGNMGNEQQNQHRLETEIKLFGLTSRGFYFVFVFFFIALPVQPSTVITQIN